MARTFVLLFSFFLLFGFAKAQTIDGRLYTQFNNYYKWRGGAFDSVLLLPNVIAGSGKRAGALRYNGADSSLYVWSGYQWRKIDGGGGSTPTLQQVTTQGNTTTDSINVTTLSGKRIVTLTSVTTGDTTGQLILRSGFNSNLNTMYSPTQIKFNNNSLSTILNYNNISQNNTISIPDSSGTLPLFVKLNGTTYNASSKGVVDLGTITSTPDSAIFATRFWVNSTFQPIGDYITTGSDASLRNLTITGTNGNGHIHLRHQASLPTATGQSTVIYANSDGNFAYKNDGNYHTTFSTNLNTADRVYKFQNKSYTLADSADVEARLKITDTSAMINGRISSITLNTSGSIHSTPITFSRVGGAWSGTMSLANQSANSVLAGPTTGSAAAPTFRALVDADIPSTSKGVQWTGVDSSISQNTARKGYHEVAEFGFANAVGMLTGSSFFYSVGANVTSIGVQEAGVNGLVRLSTSTSLTGFGAVYHFTPFYNLSSTDWMVVEYRVKIPLLNDGTEKFWIQIGLFDAPTILNIANGAAFYYMLNGDAANSASSANWQCVTANASNRTFTTTSTSVAADTWVKLTIKIKSNVADFFINDTQVATHTNNLPSTSTFLLPQLYIRKTAGSTSRSLLVDYYTCDIKYSTEK